MEGGDDGDGFIPGQEGGGGERARDGEGGVAKERNGGGGRRAAAAATTAACGGHGEEVVWGERCGGGGNRVMSRAKSRTGAVAAFIVIVIALWVLSDIILQFLHFSYCTSIPFQRYYYFNIIISMSDHLPPKYASPAQSYTDSFYYTAALKCPFNRDFLGRYSCLARVSTE